MSIAFDIDCTLNFLREELFYEVAEEFPVRGKTIRELLASYYYVGEVPEWNTPEAKQFISDILVSDWMDYVRTQKRAAESVHELASAAATLGLQHPFYLTARKEQQREKTQYWLDRNGFPALELKLRPNTCTYPSGEDWKARELARLDNEGRITLIIDDHPDLVRRLREELGSKLPIIHYAHDGPSRHDQTFRCKDWETAKKYAMSLLEANARYQSLKSI